MGSGALYFTDKRSSINTKLSDIIKSPFRFSYLYKILLISSVLFITRYLPVYVHNYLSCVVSTNLFYFISQTFLLIIGVILFTKTHLNIPSIITTFVQILYYPLLLQIAFVITKKKTDPFYKTIFFASTPYSSN